MITAREADGPLGRLRVFLLSATLDGDLIIWPQSRDVADAYAAGDPEFRAWMERTEP